MRSVVISVVAFSVVLGLLGCRWDQGKTTDNSPSGRAATQTTKPADNTLGRQTILNLVKDRQVVEVRMSLPRSTESHKFDKEYDRLMEEGVLVCKYAEAIEDGTPYYSSCRPGPSGSPLDEDLSMTIGYKMPTEITGLVKSNETSAVADLTLTFAVDPNNSLYERHRVVLDRIGTIVRNNFNDARSLAPQPGKAFLTLYDDGWRVQRVCAVGEVSCY